MQLRETSVHFRRQKFCKFPVFFPVSRESSRRRVSARLRAPPPSPNRRETVPPFAAKHAKMPVFRNISSANRTGESGLSISRFSHSFRRRFDQAIPALRNSVFSRVDGPNGQPVSPARLFNLSAKMTPVYVVDVSAATQQVSRTMDPPHRSFWGDVKMPMF